MTPGVFQPTFHGSTAGGPYGWENGFVAKLDPNGTVLWTEYVGMTEMFRDVALDSDGDIHVPTGYANEGAVNESPTPPWFRGGAFAPTRTRKPAWAVRSVASSGLPEW